MWKEETFREIRVEIVFEIRADKLILLTFYNDFFKVCNLSFKVYNFGWNVCRNCVVEIVIEMRL